MKILVLSSYAPTLFFFREDMMLAFKNAGHEVIAAAPEEKSEWQTKFKEKGIDYYQVSNIDRNGKNPLVDLKGMISIYKLIKQLKPDKIFTYQAKTVIYGAFAAKLAGVSEIYAMMGGLGSVFRNDNGSSLVKKILIGEYKQAYKFYKNVFFQNGDDVELVLKNKLIHRDKIRMTNGSGVNMEKFKVSTFDEISFLFIGRLIKDKGVLEFVEASKIVKEKYPDTRIELVGYFDTNPSAIQPEELEDVFNKGTISYLGETSDVRPFLERISTIVLPSYHEGTPKSVLEAMATGKSVITTDAPGCKETVIENRNGFLVPVKDSGILAEKMIWMIENIENVKQMGNESHQICLEKFDVTKVNEVIMRTMSL